MDPLILTAVETEKSELRHFCGVLMTDGELRLSVVSKNIRFLLCSLLYPEFLLLAAVWVVCCASESLIVALSFRHLMWGDCKDLLLQSPFFVCGVFKCCPPASKSKAFKICMSCQFQLQPRIQLLWLGSLWKGLRTFNLRCKLSISAYIRYLHARFINIISFYIHVVSDQMRISKYHLISLSKWHLHGKG